MNRGIKVLQTSALPLGYGALFTAAALLKKQGFSYINRISFDIPISENETGTIWFRAHSLWSGLRGSNPPPRPWQGRALPNELNPHRWCLRSESNQRHGDFQSPALPTELQRHTARAVPIGDPDGTRTHDL